MVAIFAESNDERSVDCTAILIDLDHTMSGDASISDLAAERVKRSGGLRHTCRVAVRGRRQ